MENLINFFVSTAHAQGAPGNEPGLAGLMFPILLVVIFYFLMIRPQTKRAKEHKAMVEGIKKGDEVLVGGLLGRVTEVGDNFVELELAEGVVVKAQRQSIGSLMPKGTLKSL